MKTDINIQNDRNSSIELLRIISMFLIVIFNVVYTIWAQNDDMTEEFMLPISKASSDPHMFIFAVFCHFENIGNSLFFITSAWYLLDFSRFKKKKWFDIFLDVWVISVIILFGALFLLGKQNIGNGMIIGSVFPVTTMANWYITCYLLFYPLHPFLNMIIHGVSQKVLLRISLTLFVLYCCINFFYNHFYYTTPLVLWITIYFVLSYFHLYQTGFCNSIKKNFVVAIVAFCFFIIMLLATNLIAQRVSPLNDKVLHWKTNCNPVILCFSFAVFNCMRNVKLKSRVINYCGGLCMLIYLIHENQILKFFIRPAIWKYIYASYGYDNIIIWVLIISAVIFVASMICAIIYKETLGRVVHCVGDSLFIGIKKLWRGIEDYLLKIKL